MADIEPPLEVRLMAKDLDHAEALVLEAAWNQTRADWHIFLDFGRIIGFRESNGTIIATAAVLPYPAGFGWISMVLVTAVWRRQGLATHLLKRCIELLLEKNATPMLDATPAGRQLYHRLGFCDLWSLSRWRRSRGNSVPPTTKVVRLLQDRDWPAVHALDALAFGGSREQLLVRLRERSANFACVDEKDGRIQGFLLGRDGRTATQLGPVVAGNDRTAGSLIEFALSRVETPVLLDMPDCHAGLARWLTEKGFVRERPFVRMMYGAKEPVMDTRRMFVIAGPELG